MRRVYIGIVLTFVAITVVLGYVSNTRCRSVCEELVRNDVRARVDVMRRMHWWPPAPEFVRRRIHWLSSGDVEVRRELSPAVLAPTYRPIGEMELPWAYVVSDIRVPFLLRVFAGFETTGQGGTAWVRDSVCVFGRVLWSRQRPLGMS